MRDRGRGLLGWFLLLSASLLAAAGAALARVQLPAAAATGLAALAAGIAGLLTMRGAGVLKDHDDELRSGRGAIRLAGRGRIPLVRELDDPISLGVHPAASIDEHGIPSRVPGFIARDVMPQVRRAIEAGGFVLLVGESTAGKSRAAFEAMRESLRDWRLIDPVDRDAVRTAAEIAATTPSSVLWLDDLERFLGSGGLTAEDVRRVLHGRGGRSVILATMRSEEYARFSERSESHLPSLGRETTRQGWDVLRLATRLDVTRRWSAQELARAASRRDDERIDDALRHAGRFGLAEYLASGPQLLTEWRDAWAPGTHPRGAALVSAAVDARRVGLHRPLPSSLLAQLHELYLDPRGGLLLRPEPLEAAIEWAASPLHATSSLLLPAAGQTYVAFDYLVDAADKVPVPPAALELLASAATADEAMDLARVAWRWRLYDQADAAFRAADANGHPDAVGALCDLLFDRGSEKEAVALAHASLDDRMRRLGPDHALTLDARHTVAYSIGTAGAPQEAVRLYEELVADASRLLGDDHALTRNVRARPAQFTGEAGDPRKAARMYTELAEEWTRVLGEGVSDVLRTRDQAALWLERAGDVDLAARLRAALLDDVVRFGADPEEVDHAHYALARAMTAGGRYQDALPMWRQLVADRLRVDGRYSVMSLEVRSELAECAGLAGDTQQAVALLHEVMGDASRFGTDKGLDSIRYARELAHWIGKAGDPREAATRLRQLLETTMEWRGVQDRHAVGIRWRMADWSGEAGDVTEAVRELEEVAAAAEAALGCEHGVTRSAGQCLAKWRRRAVEPPAESATSRAEAGDEVP
jgi:hypothetical protein